MGRLKVSDNAVTTLSASLTNSPAVTSLSLTDASKFPVVNQGGTGSDWSYITLYDASGNLEIVKVTRRDSGSNTLTIVRGTAAGITGVTDASCRAWASGSGTGVACRLIADSINAIGAALDTGGISTTMIADSSITSAKLDSDGVALPDGSTAVTQAGSDNSLKVATTAWVRSAMSAIATAAGFVLATGLQNAPAYVDAGYLKLPSWLGGFIIQWGRTSLTATDITITYPLAFPNELSSISVINEYSTLSGANYKRPYVLRNLTTKDKTYVLVRSEVGTDPSGNHPEYYTWTAIGK